MSRIVFTDRGPYRRSGKKRGPGDDALYADWSSGHDFCQFCGVGALDAFHERWPGLSTHHLVRGAGRSHEACNLLRACQRCHDLAEARNVRAGGVLLPHMTMAVCLTVKFCRDRADFDAERLAALRGRPLPSPLPIPAAIEEEYRRRRPWDRGRFFCGELPSLGD